MLELGFLAVLGLAAIGVIIWLLGKSQKPTDQDIRDKFPRLRNFTVTEVYAYDGAGMAADEQNGRLAILGDGRQQIALIAGKDLIRWSYLPEDGEFKLVIASKRHPDPFAIRFKKSRDADLWLKILKNIKEF